MHIYFPVPNTLNIKENEKKDENKEEENEQKVLSNFVQQKTEPVVDIQNENQPDEEWS